uniref:Uncharacterized protein n=1 Tax=Cacopsylla melanoneura TaxID=428564 RepID=A0A8D8QRX3_9HEMI
MTGPNRQRCHRVHVGIRKHTRWKPLPGTSEVQSFPLTIRPSSIDVFVTIFSKFSTDVSNFLRTTDWTNLATTCCEILRKIYIYFLERNNWQLCVQILTKILIFKL